MAEPQIVDLFDRTDYRPRRANETQLAHLHTCHGRRRPPRLRRLRQPTGRVPHAVDQRGQTGRLGADHDLGRAARSGAPASAPKAGKLAPWVRQGYPAVNVTGGFVQVVLPALVAVARQRRAYLTGSVLTPATPWRSRSVDLAIADVIVARNRLTGREETSRKLMRPLVRNAVPLPADELTALAEALEPDPDLPETTRDKRQLASYGCVRLPPAGSGAPGTCSCSSSSLCSRSWVSPSPSRPSAERGGRAPTSQGPTTHQPRRMRHRDRHRNTHRAAADRRRGSTIPACVPDIRHWSCGDYGRPLER